MLVKEFASALMTAPHSRFPYVEKPFYSHTDFPWLNGVLVWQRNDEFISDYDAQCIHPAPVAVYHDQGGGYGYDDIDPGPSVGWADVGTIPHSFRENSPHNFTEFHVKQTSADADNGVFGAEAEVACQGVTFLWSRTDQEAKESLDSTVKKFTTFRVGVGWGSDRVLYSVRYTGQGEVKIAISNDEGATWVELETLRQQGEYEASWGIPDEMGSIASGSSGSGSSGGEEGNDAPRSMNYLEFRLIAGRMQIWTGSNGPYTYAEHRINAEGGVIATINHLAIFAYKFRSFSASGHPTKWRPSCVYDSPEIPIGFVNENVLQPYIDPAGPVPDGAYANVYELYPGSLAGPIITYRLVLGSAVSGTFNGEDYSDFCAAVRAITFSWPSQIRYLPAAPITTLPESIDVSHSFNPETLQIESSGQLVFNNNRPRALGPWGQGTFGDWMRETGQTAMDIWLTRTTPTGAIPAPVRTFAGYAHTMGRISAAPNGSYFTMQLADRKIQLQNPRFALPWLDGWNAFYAVAYLAQLGGVDLSDMTFSPYVPNVPFGPGSDLGSPESPFAYYLPVGDAGSVLTRFSGAHLWEVMSKIAFTIGYMLFFDANGQLQFRKFTMPAGVKRTFYESDHESTVQLGGGLEGCWNIESQKDLGEVRNTSITIGMEAFTKYRPIVYKYTDFDSIYNPLAFNHLGYENAAVWMDSQFGNEAFAGAAALEMYRFLRMPGFTVQFTTWLQPDIFPLDMIMVHSPKCGTYGVRFMVVSVQHHVESPIAHSTIVGRFIPDF